MGKDNFEIFKETMHMLSWLGYESFDSLKVDIGNSLSEQAPGFILEHVDCLKGPEYMTAGVQQEDGSLIVSKMSVAFTAEVLGKLNGDVIRSVGVWNFVGIKLNDPENMECSIHYDVDSSLEEVANQANIIVRLYELENKD